MTVTVTGVVDRCGVPDHIDWGDPIALTYGECVVALPRTMGRPSIVITGPTLDAILAVLNPEPTVGQAFDAFAAASGKVRNVRLPDPDDET